MRDILPPSPCVCCGRAFKSRYRVIANLRTIVLGLRRDFAQIEPKSDLSTGLKPTREAAEAAASSAAKVAEASNAMLGGARTGVALEQRTPVKGTPVKGPSPGASPPALSTRVMSAAKKGLTKLSPSASTPVPKAAPGRAKPERRTRPAARG